MKGIKMHKPVLQGCSLKRSFTNGPSTTIALNDVSIDLYPGEVSLIMGPSGSGKSTLLSIISGLSFPDSGQVIAHGQDLARLSEKERKEFRLRHCGFVFQGHNLFPALTASEQLEIVLGWGTSTSGRKARDEAREMLGRLGLSKKTHLRPEQLSGGEKQRVAIGRALIKKPTLCFADEPTSALNWELGKEVIGMLRQAAEEDGATVVVVAHDARIQELADRTFHMEDGRIVSHESRLVLFEGSTGNVADL
jgi:putative ABC transport system ATP-binding protein